MASFVVSFFMGLFLFHQDDLGDEREANMLAVIAAAKFWKDADIVSQAISCFFLGCSASDAATTVAHP